MSGNKQRLIKLSNREKAAADCGGIFDESMYDQKIIEYLSGIDGTDFNLEPILEKIGNRAGWFYLMQEYQDIVPKQKAKQARDTADVIVELLDRLEHMHPEVAAVADAMLWKANGEFALQMTRRISPDLLQMRAILIDTADTMDELSSSAGPKAKSERDRAYAEVLQTLKSNSQPSLRDADARIIAADLLQLCGISTPTDDREQRRIIKRGG